MCKLLNMGAFRKVWLVMALLLCFINSRCQANGFCQGAPVVRVCTNDSCLSQGSVNIVTSKVPQSEVITCRCVISSSGFPAEFVFTYHSGINNKGNGFRINNLEFNAASENKTILENETDLFFITTSNSSIVHSCLTVSAENMVKFKITCFKNSINSTPNPVRTSTPNSFSGINNVTSPKMDIDGTSESETNIMIPIGAATASGVSIAVVIALVVVCRRRTFTDKQTSKALTTVVEKEKEDEYYMTENPMYNVTDSEPDIQSAEREYHYIETENQGGSMPYCQYDIIRDSLVTGEISEKKDDLHYDYTTCTSTRAKSGPELADKVDENKSQNKTVLEQESKLTADDTMYDRTDRTATKHFQSVNDYHHISPAASRKRVAIDTYNTCGEAKCQNAHIKK